jgi:hypothetical protein
MPSCAASRPKRWCGCGARNVADNKRMLQQLKLALGKHGDISLSEAIKRTTRGYGRPPSWTLEKLGALRREVNKVKNTTKAGGMSQRRACMAVAASRGISLKVVEKRYAQACEAARPKLSPRALEAFDMAMEWIAMQIALSKRFERRYPGQPIPPRLSELARKRAAAKMRRK